MVDICLTASLKFLLELQDKFKPDSSHLLMHHLLNEANIGLVLFTQMLIFL